MFSGSNAAEADQHFLPAPPEGVAAVEDTGDDDDDAQPSTAPEGVCNCFGTMHLVVYITMTTWCCLVC